MAKKDNITMKSMGRWCSSPDKDGNVKCVPFEEYKKMTQEEKMIFNANGN